MHIKPYLYNKLPEPIPINKEKIRLRTKLFNMINIVVKPIVYACSPPNISNTDLNRIIATASFIIPSPNIIENNLGYLSAFIIVKAATESVAQIVAEKNNIVVVEKYTGWFRSLNYRIKSKCQTMCT